jgi:hypothetical protein
MRNCYTNCEHLEFLQHLKHNGKIYRNDTLNNIQEVLDENNVTERHGCICGICVYGYTDLTCIEENHYLHIKSGDLYKVLFKNVINANNSGNGELYTVYAKSGQLFCRNSEEFDQKFKRLLDER